MFNLQINSKMFVTTKENKEFHKNGTLAYIETIAILNPLFVQTYERRIVKQDGSEFIRIGLHAKYFDNGQLAWKLEYNDLGNLIKNNNPQYRKDGSTIIF